MINIPGALWGDVFVAGYEVIGCAYDRDDSVVIEYYKMSGEGDEIQIIRAYEDTVIAFDEKVLHVRADTDGHDIRVMGQGAGTGKFMINGPDNPGLLTYGTHSCDLDNRLNYIVQVSTTHYYDSLSGAFHPIPEVIHGTSNGFIQLLPGGIPVWADLARASISEMLYPFSESNVYVGEGAADPAHIQAREDGVQKNIYLGYAARPRAAWDSASNTFAVAARSESGVNFHFFRRPLTDLTVVIPPVEPPVEPPPIEPPVEPPVEPEEPMACTPVVPPQDVVQRSLDSLRQFCQTYCFPGPDDHPYKADEIHENGLFIADGLIYFMMSDTGNWAKTLMNPDDKRDWESKRISADNALFDYMRRRVGDSPASTAPGGTLTGDVNV